MAQRAIRHYLRQPDVIGYTRKGKPVLSIGGGSGEPPPGDDDDTGDGAGDEDDDDEDDKDGAGGSGDDIEAVKRRMQAADRRASALEEELADLRKFKKDAEDADKSVTEKLESDLSEATQRAESAEGRAQAAEQKLAIVLANGKRKVPFRDADDVLRYVNPDDVTDDKGNVDGKKLTEALDELAKAKAYLLSDVSGDDNEDDEEPGGQSSGRLKGKQSKGGIDKEALKKKYPALRR